MKKISFEEVYSNEYVRDSVNIVVAQTVAINPCLKSYADDMKQDLWLHINRSLPRFNGEASIESFLRTVIDRRINNVVRKYSQQISIIGIHSEELDSVEAAGVFEKPALQHRMLEIDIQSTLGKLDQQSQKICRMLMDGESMAEIARTMGIVESKLFYQYIYPLRKKFINEGLDKYLELC